MIPRAYIARRGERVPWNEDFQVARDVFDCRALVVMSCSPALAAAPAFRGGRAPYKPCLKPSVRSSDDTELVQVSDQTPRVRDS